MLTATAESTIVKQGCRQLGIVDHIRTRIGNFRVKIFQGEAKDAEERTRVGSVALPEPIADPHLLASIILGHCFFDQTLIASPYPRESGRVLMYIEYLTPIYCPQYGG
jgi:hypothetical protein